MGADMILSVVAIKKDAKPDWEAGDEFLAKLKIDEDLARDLIDYGSLDEGNEDYFDDDGKPIESAIRNWLIGGLQEFNNYLDSREVASFAVRDLWLYVTGGMSWGDDTDAGYAFQKVSSVPGLLGSMGFVEDYWDVDKTVTPEEEAAALDSIAKATP